MYQQVCDKAQNTSVLRALDQSPSGDPNPLQVCYSVQQYHVLSMPWCGKGPAFSQKLSGVAVLQLQLGSTEQWFSKCGPHTRNINRTWELARTAHSHAPFLTLRNHGGGPASCFNSPSMWSWLLPRFENRWGSTRFLHVTDNCPT